MKLSFLSQHIKIITLFTVIDILYLYLFNMKIHTGLNGGNRRKAESALSV